MVAVLKHVGKFFDTAYFQQKVESNSSALGRGWPFVTAAVNRPWWKTDFMASDG